MDLFDYADRYPHVPASGKRDTSEAAAEAIAPTAGTLRSKAYDALLSSGKFGFTADEVAEKIGVTILAGRPRITELSKQGMIKDSERRRQNASGKKAIVWVAQ